MYVCIQLSRSCVLYTHVCMCRVREVVGERETDRERDREEVRRVARVGARARERGPEGGAAKRTDAQ